MPADLRVTLPTGLLSERGRAGEAWLRPLNGADELMLHEAAAAGAPRAALSSMLLAACTTAIGQHTPVDEALADRLCVGDREALLLHLYRLTFGDAIQAVLSCPACGELLDLELRAGDLLLAPADTAELHTILRLEADGAAWRVELRRVTGEDLRGVTPLPDAARLLMWRCVRQAIREDGVVWPVRDLPDTLVGEIDRALAWLDPQAELRLDFSCAACAQSFSAPFDAAAHLFAELAAEAPLLVQEVTTLARHLHWRESDILAMPRGRRRAYAALAGAS